MNLGCKDVPSGPLFTSATTCSISKTMKEPSIKDLLLKHHQGVQSQMTDYNFLKPSQENGTLREAVKAERQKRDLEGPARVVVMQRNMATYCHRNPRRMKRIHVLAGKFRLWIEVNGKMEMVELSETFSYEIPANAWHAVQCLMTSAGRGAGLLLVETNLDVNDAEWEAEARS